LKTIAQLWDDSIVPAITEYIRIPAKSPHFDRDWQKHGHIEAALQLAAARGEVVPGKPPARNEARGGEARRANAGPVCRS
jgi:hypothetical protein